MHIERLKKYMRTKPTSEQEDFANKCGTTVGQIQQIYYGNRKCEGGLAIEIEKHSKGSVIVESLRPDMDWGFIRRQKETA